MQNWDEWMTLAQQGDSEAYRKLLEELYPAARAYLMRRIGPLSILDDCVQDCILSVHQSRHTYDPHRPFRPWFYAVIRYKCLDLLRKYQRRAVKETEFDENLATISASETYSIHDDSYPSISLALASIPEKFRLPLELTKVQGLSTREAAKKLQISETAIRSRLSRAYKALKEKLERELIKHNDETD